MTTVVARRWTAAAVVAAVFAVGGCTGSSSSEHTGTSAASSALTACANREAPSSRVRLPDPGAPDYAGAGPHLAVVGESFETGAEVMNHTPPSTYSLPGTWEALDATSLEPDPAHAQLVVCLSRVARRTGSRIGTCVYQRTRADVFPADYTFDVYTARTGRRVSQLVISGDESPRRSCPDVVGASWGKDFVVARGLSADAFTSRLRPLVTGRAS